MKDYHYLPVNGGEETKTYIFQAELETEQDGRWSAWIEALPGCATWGYTKEETLESLKDAAQTYVEVLLRRKKYIPSFKGVEARDVPAIAVTV